MATLETVVVMRANSVHGNSTKIEGKRTQYLPMEFYFLQILQVRKGERVSHEGKNESRRVYWMPNEESIEREGMVISVKSCYEA